MLLPLNSGFNYLLIYGAFGVPELGGAGSGLGTSLAYWVLLGISVLVLFKQEKLKALHLEKRIPLNMDKIKEGVRFRSAYRGDCLRGSGYLFCGADYG